MWLRAQTCPLKPSTITADHSSNEERGNKMITATETKLPRLLMELPGPQALKMIAYDAKFMSPSFSREYPLVAKKGYGAIVEDADGNAFLDFAAGIAVCSTGHCHPKVVEAIQKQAAELIHISGT